MIAPRTGAVHAAKQFDIFSPSQSFSRLPIDENRKLRNYSCCSHVIAVTIIEPISTMNNGLTFFANVNLCRRFYVKLSETEVAEAWTRL
jgi:hypothetical protein